MATFGDVKKLEEQPESEGDTEDTEDEEDGMIKEGATCRAVPQGAEQFWRRVRGHFVVPHRLGNQPGNWWKRSTIFIMR